MLRKTVSPRYSFDTPVRLPEPGQKSAAGATRTTETLSRSTHALHDLPPRFGIGLEERSGQRIPQHQEQDGRCGRSGRRRETRPHRGVAENAAGREDRCQRPSDHRERAEAGLNAALRRGVRGAGRRARTYFQGWKCVRERHPFIGAVRPDRRGAAVAGRQAVGQGVLGILRSQPTSTRPRGPTTTTASLNHNPTSRPQKS